LRQALSVTFLFDFDCHWPPTAHEARQKPKNARLAYVEGVMKSQRYSIELSSHMQLQTGYTYLLRGNMESEYAPLSSAVQALGLKVIVQVVTPLNELTFFETFV
jgi:hypothetical protein